MALVIGNNLIRYIDLFQLEFYKAFVLRVVGVTFLVVHTKQIELLISLKIYHLKTER